MAEKIRSYHSSTGEILWEGIPADKQVVDTAVQQAEKAFKAWSAMPVSDRLPYIVQFTEILKSKLEELALALSEENGKPLWESKQEIQSMINKSAISIEAYNERCAPKTKEISPSNRLATHFKPHGVVAVLGPFNFPGHLPNGHIVPALIAGNTVVFKPSELTPRFGQLMIDCWMASGLPFNGIVNIVQGAAETGQHLVRHPKIKGVFFTGSDRTGIALAETLASHPEKILALEMGGNNPLIIGQIDNTQAAAYLTIQSAYISSGQRCSCARRLIVPTGKDGDVFLKELLNLINTIAVGFYTDKPEPFMGPVISLKAADNLLKAQEELKAKGGQILYSMRPLVEGKSLLTPGLIDVTAISDRPDVEYFGPLLQLIRVKNFTEAIQEAAKTRFGLTAGIFTKDRSEYEALLNALPAGVINWNNPLTGASSWGPFGGVGWSGNHRPSAYFAADYCSYPVASLESETVNLPTHLLPGIRLNEQKETL